MSLSSWQVCVNINSVHNRYCGYNNSLKHNNIERRHSAHTSDVSFGCGALKASSGSEIIYKQMGKLVSTIDGILGKDNGVEFFSSNIEKAKKAGLKIENDSFVFKTPSMKKDVISTIKYPFTDMPVNIVSAVCKGLKKTPLSSLGNKIENFSPIKKQIERVQAKKSYELVYNILDQLVGDSDESIERIGNKVTLKTANKITKIAKNYASRDERTLNRLVTGAVGAYMSSTDMFNISMLEKDDKKAAVKAGKDRWEQEMTRIGISAGLTFLSLGALNKYAKGSDVKSAAIVALSALTAEVISRVRKHKPLYPISPERAARIAEKQNKNKGSSSNTVEIAMMRLNKNDKNNLYKDFTQDKSITATVQKEQVIPETKKEEKKKTSALVKIALVSLAASAVYLASRYMKGNYSQRLKRLELFNNSDIQKELNAFLEGKVDKLKNTTINAIDEANNAIPKIFDSEKEIKILKNKSARTIYESLCARKNNILKSANKFLEGEDTVDLKKLEEGIDRLIKTENGKDIESLLNIYKEHIGKLSGKLKNLDTKKCKQNVKKPVLSAILAGVTKLFKTLYSILALPGAAVDAAINKKFIDSEPIFKKVEAKLNVHDSEKQVEALKDELSRLNEIFKKNSGKKNEYDKIINEIKTQTRNFEPSADIETGNLANLSRTLVTLISSWFYISDFRNTVLIESGGKNTERAKEVTNDSISFKLWNFFFNGTLMNLANSLFKETLNKSLLGATIIPFCTEIINEFMIRTTISRPMRKLNSREEIVEYDQKRRDKKGPVGDWTRFYKKITGQKSLVEKYEAQQAKKK